MCLMQYNDTDGSIAQQAISILLDQLEIESKLRFVNIY
jgi:hypothetical protein